MTRRALPSLVVRLPFTCGDGALIEFREPTITVRVKGVVPLEEPTVS